MVGHSLGAAFALRLVKRAVEPFTGLFLTPCRPSASSDPFTFRGLTALRIDDPA